MAKTNRKMYRPGRKSDLRRECQGKSTAALHRAAHRQVFGKAHKSQWHLTSAVVIPSQAVLDATDFNSLTVPQLRVLARAQAVTGYSKMKRKELIQALS